MDLKRLFSFKRKKSKESPTDLWVRDEDPNLVVDLSSYSLCGVKLGEPIEKLSFLGPCDMGAFRDKHFNYDGLGVYIGQHEGLFYSFHISIEENETSMGYTGEWMFQNEKMGISRQTKRAWIRGVFGEPTMDGMDDGTDLCLFYDLEDAAVEFMWDDYELFKYVEVNWHGNDHI